MTAIGKGYVATLSTNMRGSIERRPAITLKEAFMQAGVLLALAAVRDWHRGEAISVRIEQSDE